MTTVCEDKQRVCVVDTKADFDAVVSGKALVVVKFTATWCSK
jgi:hypothetical protein